MVYRIRFGSGVSGVRIPPLRSRSSCKSLGHRQIGKAAVFDTVIYGFESRCPRNAWVEFLSTAGAVVPRRQASSTVEHWLHKPLVMGSSPMFATLVTDKNSCGLS